MQTNDRHRVNECTEMVSIMVANKGSNNHCNAAPNSLVKTKSERYLIMPKNVEEIAVVLEGEDKGTCLLNTTVFYYKLMFSFLE